MSLLWSFSLLLLAIVLEPFHTEQASFALAAEGPKWKFGRDNTYNDGPFYSSDYPSNDDIEEEFRDPGPGKFFMWSDVPDTPQTPRTLVAYTRKYQKLSLLSCFPFFGPNIHFAYRNGRSQAWFEDFQNRLMQIWISHVSGELDLVATWSGPTCKEWTERDFPALKLVKGLTSIRLVDVNDIERTRQYWPSPEEPDSEEDPPTNQGGGGGTVQNILEGGNQNLDGLLRAGGLGGIIAPAAAQMLPPAAAAILSPAAAQVGNPVGPSILNLESPSSTDQLNDVIDHPTHLGDGWQANIPSESFGEQAMVLPNNVLGPPDTSQGSFLRPRDGGTICSVLTEWGGMIEFPGNSPPGSSNGGAIGGDTFHLGLESAARKFYGAITPFPVVDAAKAFLGLAAETLLTVTVIQTRLASPEIERNCQLQITVTDVSNQAIAAGTSIVRDSVEARVEGTKLKTPIYVWWTGLQDWDLLHFRSGDAPGTSWDSSDKIKCKTDPYENDARKVSCSYTP